MVTDTMMNRREVEARVGLGRSSLYRMMRDGTFPEPLKVGARAVRWPASEIEDWMSKRARATGEINDPTLQRRAETKTPTVNEVFTNDGSTDGGAAQRS